MAYLTAICKFSAAITVNTIYRYAKENQACYC